MPVVFENDLLFLAASKARCISQFQHPAELWKTGMPALRHNTGVAKISLIAVTTNPDVEENEVWSSNPTKHYRDDFLVLSAPIPTVFCGNTWDPTQEPCSVLDIAKANHVC